MNHQCAPAASAPTPYACSFHHYNSVFVEDLLWSLRARGYSQADSIPSRTQFVVRTSIWACRAPARGSDKPCMWTGTEQVRSCPRCGRRKVREETLVEWMETVSWGRAQEDPEDRRVRKGEPARLKVAGRQEPRREEAQVLQEVDEFNDLPESWAVLFERLDGGGGGVRMVLPLT